jgi:exonuclease III
MDISGNWNVLCWNVRGLNDQDKWGMVRNKIEESGCSMFCFQETKLEEFNLFMSHKFAPRRFDCFEFSPSAGASGGILVAWNSKFFSANTVDIQPFAVHIQVTSVHNLETWQLITVYGPTREPERTYFVSWLYSLNLEEDDQLLLLGDFNFYRTTANKNKAGGNANDMLLFNDVIHTLGLVELPLKGRSYTWSNM